LTNVEVTGAAVARFSRREIAEFARRALIALDHLGRINSEISEVTIAIVDDEAMRNLNRKFRKKNKTTDVPPVPADDSDADPQSPGRPLGDIVISIDQARRQAAEQKHSLATEIRYLILHGTLHALGYDHTTDNGEMNDLEVEVRGKVGLE
jgi:probable rRNA maturation factor